MNRRWLLNRKNLFALVGLAIISLIGIQIYWINSTIRLQKLAAERNLRNDLTKVIKDVEESAYCFYYYSKAYIKKDEGIYMIKQSAVNDSFFGPPLGYIDTLSMYNIFYYKKDTLFDKNSSLTFQTPATVDISLKFKFAIPSPHVKKIDTNSYKLPNINMADFRKALSNSQTLDGLINPDNLDSLIKDALRRNDFDTVFELGIKRVGSTAYEYLKQGSLPVHLEKGLIKVSFLGDNFNSPYELFLYLPDPAGRTIRSLLLVMICSIAIILVLIVSYALFVRTILNQKKLSEMKSMFINNITHEFNTPITNIHLALENMRNAGTNTEFYARIIDEENNHLQKNVEQMLQLAAIEHTKVNICTEHIDLNELIRETVASFAIQLEKVGGAIDLQLAPRTAICGDRQLLRNMLFNLIDNSIKYRSKDLHILIRTSDAADHATLEVQDNGMGMAPETVKYIFQPFYRGDKSDRHDVKGFGIGLSYVKYIADLHRGKISVRSRRDGGATFTIVFTKPATA